MSFPLKHRSAQVSARKASASRMNGRKGGRPRKTEADRAAELKAQLEKLAHDRFEIERPANIQFLVDVRTGLVPDATVADRIRAAESMLDRDPATARIRGEVDRPAPAKEAPKLVELADSEPFEAPAGWTDRPSSNGHEGGQP